MLMAGRKGRELVPERWLVFFLDSKDVKSIFTVTDAKKADAGAEADSH